MTKQQYLDQLAKWEREYQAKRQLLGYEYHASLTESQKQDKPLWQYRLQYR